MSQVDVCKNCGRNPGEHHPNSKRCYVPGGGAYYEPKDDKPYTANDPKFVFSGWRSPDDLKIKIPEGMLKAAIRRSRHSSLGLSGHDKVIENAVEEALGWMAENPIVPTAEQLYSTIGKLPVAMCDIVWTERDRAMIAEWQRRMFLAPKPEVPKEIKDLLFVGGIAEEGDCISEVTRGYLDTRILEAFRRGQQSKSTTGR